MLHESLLANVKALRPEAAVLMLKISEKNPKLPLVGSRVLVRLSGCVCGSLGSISGIKASSSRRSGFGLIDDRQCLNERNEIGG